MNERQSHANVDTPLPHKMKESVKICKNEMSKWKNFERKGKHCFAEQHRTGGKTFKIQWKIKFHAYTCRFNLKKYKIEKKKWRLRECRRILIKMKQWKILMPLSRVSKQPQIPWWSMLFIIICNHVEWPRPSTLSHLLNSKSKPITQANCSWKIRKSKWIGAPYDILFPVCLFNTIY